MRTTFLRCLSSIRALGIARFSVHLQKIRGHHHQFAARRMQTLRAGWIYTELLFIYDIGMHSSLRSFNSGVASSEHSTTMIRRATKRSRLCVVLANHVPTSTTTKPRPRCDHRLPSGPPLHERISPPTKFCHGGCSRMTFRFTLSVWLGTIGLRTLSTRERQQSRIRVDVFLVYHVPGRVHVPPCVIVLCLC